MARFVKEGSILHYTVNKAGNLYNAQRNCGYVIKLDGDDLLISPSRLIDRELDELIRLHVNQLVQIHRKFEAQQEVPV